MNAQRMAALRAETVLTRLRELGIATSEQIEQAKAELAKTHERFSVILVRQGVLRDPEAGKRLAGQLGSLPQRVDVPSAGATATAHRVSAAVWRTQRLAPVAEREGTLTLATDDPLAVFTLDALGRQCGCRLEAVLVLEQDLGPLLSGLSAAGPSPAPGPAPMRTAAQREPTSSALAPREAPPPGKPGPGAGGAAAAGGDEPIIQLVDSMLAEAVRMRASDVHIEPSREALRVRYRIDGVLHDVNSPPKALHGPIVSRIKIMAGLNIAEKRLPQDGRIQLAVERRLLDARISTLPAVHGESVVMRLLDRSQPIRGLAEMGIGAQDQQAWERLIRRPHGMVLVTGPTGSGKTTTLYGALAALNQADRKLITVEDPVEYQLAGVNQVSVKPAIGLTFAAGLRAMLRQAPDVVMVGEIRDAETAQIAIQAALTGHLVLSTLHTNDAPSAVTRLIDMGIAPFLIASTLQGVLAQRLIRRICPSCRMTDNVTPEERAFLGEPEVIQVIRSNGCEQCHRSGFYGRMGIFELLQISEPVRKLIVAKAGASAIRVQAIREGMRGLRQDGCAKIRDGLTTMAEVLRVVSDMASGAPAHG